MVQDNDVVQAESVDQPFIGDVHSPQPDKSNTAFHMPLHNVTHEIVSQNFTEQRPVLEVLIENLTMDAKNNTANDNIVKYMKAIIFED